MSLRLKDLDFIAWAVGLHWSDMSISGAEPRPVPDPEACPGKHVCCIWVLPSLFSTAGACLAPSSFLLLHRADDLAAGHRLECQDHCATCHNDTTSALLSAER